MACYLNIIRSLNVKQTILLGKSCYSYFGRQSHSNVGTIKFYSMDYNHLSLTKNGIACATYNPSKNETEIEKNTFTDNDHEKVRAKPSRKPIPLPEDDTNTSIQRKKYSRPI